MNYAGAKRRKKSGRYPFLFALSVFALCAAIAYWALTALFPAELHQVGQWLQAKVATLRK